MATAYHNFGPCIPQVSTGANSAYEVLGVCQNGGRVAIEYLHRPIRSDLGGEAPVEEQQMGVRARVTMEIIAPDKSVLSKVRARSGGTAAGTGEGTPATPGTLMGTSGAYFSLYLPSSNEDPWRFTSCKLASDEIKEGTESEPARLVFDAIRYVAGSANTVANTTLYTRV